MKQRLPKTWPAAATKRIVGAAGLFSTGRFSTGLFAIGLTVFAQASAASQCKGLETEACNSTAACSWVAGYQRKDGRAVNAFCRTKAQRSEPKDARAETVKEGQQG